MEGQQTEAAMPEPIEVGGSSMRPHDQTHNNAAQPLNNDADQPNGPSSTTSSNASTLVQQTENPSGPDTSAGGASRPQMDPRESVSFQPNAQSQVQAPKIAHRPTLKRQETKLAQKNAHPMEHLGITLGLPAIILFDLVVPCIIYYEWYNRHRGQWDDQCRPYFEINTECPIPFKGYDTTILGSAIASFGVGELWIWLARSYRLLRRPDDCAPLLSRSRWELDATSWVYLVSMVLALVGFLVGSSRDIPKLYLYSPSILMAFLGLLMAVTAFAPFTLPIGINSHARGSKLRPFIYYAAEDFIAVDVCSFNYPSLVVFKAKTLIKMDRACKTENSASGTTNATKRIAYSDGYSSI